MVRLNRNMWSSRRFEGFVDSVGSTYASATGDIGSITGEASAPAPAPEYDQFSAAPAPASLSEYDQFSAAPELPE
jgi:hypothetical protein